MKNCKNTCDKYQQQQQSTTNTRPDYSQCKTNEELAKYPELDLLSKNICKLRIDEINLAAELINLKANTPNSPKIHGKLQQLKTNHLHIIEKIAHLNNIMTKLNEKYSNDMDVLSTKRKYYNNVLYTQNLQKQNLENITEDIKIIDSSLGKKYYKYYKSLRTKMNYQSWTQIAIIIFGIGFGILLCSFIWIKWKGKNILPKVLSDGMKRFTTSVTSKISGSLN